MRSIPSFSLLRAFEAAARLSSFTLAAEELHLTQSAVSHQIRKLEDYFGRALFLRRNRRIELTVEGLRLHDSLTRVFDVIEAACREVQLAPHSQVLAVHCPPSLAVKWLGPKLGDFYRGHPGITIRLTTGATPLNLARTQDVDVAISYGMPPEVAGVVTCALGKEWCAPLCAPGLRPELGDFAQIMRESTLIESQLSPVGWEEWCRLNNLAVPSGPRPSFDRAAMAIAAAADGMGVALESVRLAERELARGELVILGEGKFKRIEREIHHVAYRVKERRVPKVAEFVAWLLSLAGN
jgi:DNA-binding transcriptional LysR family regulator